MEMPAFQNSIANPYNMMMPGVVLRSVLALCNQHRQQPYMMLELIVILSLTLQSG